MKRRDLERHLSRHGAQELREGGRHSLWRSADGRTTAIPRHREIGVGLVRKTCKCFGSSSGVARELMQGRRGGYDHRRRPGTRGARRAAAAPRAQRDQQPEGVDARHPPRRLARAPAGLSRRVHAPRPADPRLRSGYAGVAARSASIGAEWRRHHDSSPTTHSARVI
ncbi:MAG: type II toxin-antitoxin system HicA family toxin [Thermoleophilaceae bacterium]